MISISPDSLLKQFIKNWMFSEVDSIWVRTWWAKLKIIFNWIIWVIKSPFVFLMIEKYVLFGMMKIANGGLVCLISLGYLLTKMITIKLVTTGSILKQNSKKKIISWWVILPNWKSRQMIEKNTYQICLIMIEL